MIEGLKPRKIFWPAAQLQDLLASGGLKSVFAQMLRFMVNPLIVGRHETLSAVVVVVVWGSARTADATLAPHCAIKT